MEKQLQIGGQFPQAPAEATRGSIASAAQAGAQFMVLPVQMTLDRQLVLAYTDDLTARFPKPAQPFLLQAHKGRTAISQFLMSELGDMDMPPLVSLVDGLRTLRCFAQHPRAQIMLPDNPKVTADLVLRDATKAIMSPHEVRLLSTSVSTLAVIRKQWPKLGLGLMFRAPAQNGYEADYTLDRLRNVAPTLKKLGASVHPAAGTLTELTSATAGHYGLAISTYEPQGYEPTRHNICRDTRSTALHGWWAGGAAVGAASQNFPDLCRASGYMVRPAARLAGPAAA